MKIAGEGGYDGTIFHRMVPRGMVQGGDPLSKDPAKARGVRQRRPERGQGRRARAEDDAGARWRRLRCRGSPTAAARSSSSCWPISRRSTASTASSGTCRTGWKCWRRFPRRPSTQPAWRPNGSRSGKVTIRDTPPEPFVNERASNWLAIARFSTPARDRSRSSFSPTRRPTRSASSCAWQRPVCTTAWRFIASRPGFVIQTGAEGTRAVPFTEKQQAAGPRTARPEFNDTKHVKGIVSMARGADPGSATTSFFICTGPSTALDGQYTAFGRVIDGMAAVEAIEKAPRTTRRRVARIDLRTITIEMGR